MTTTDENNNSQKNNDSKSSSSVEDVAKSSSKDLSAEGAKDVKTENAGESASKESQQDQASDLDQEKDSSTQELKQVAETEGSEDKGEALKEEEAPLEASLPELYLNGLYATKLGMSSIYNDQGQMVPVTVLKFDIWRVTQVKTKERDGYTAIQLGSHPKSERKSSLPGKGHLKLSGFSTNVTFLREIRGEVPAQPSKDNEKDQPVCQPGQVLSIHSLAKGDRVHLSSISKGRGFAGTMKRWGYSGGPASHGSQFHRKPGFHRYV